VFQVQRLLKKEEVNYSIKEKGQGLGLRATENSPFPYLLTMDAARTTCSTSETKF